MRTNTVKAALREGQAQIGTWLSLASPLAARFMTRSGFHWLTLDMEHTPVDWSVAAQIFGTIADAGGIPLVRIPFNSLENVKRALDAGAYGIVFPMCNTVEEAERAVAACKYPPQGERSIGGALHTLNFRSARAGILPPRQRRDFGHRAGGTHCRRWKTASRYSPFRALTACSSAPTICCPPCTKRPAWTSEDPAFWTP